jgi:hypothetical protein
MEKSALLILVFIGGAVAGALAMRAYVKANALELLGPGAAEQLTTKLGGGSTLAGAAGGVVQGLVAPP